MTPSDQGVVLVETPVRYPAYSLNRQHLAAPHIEGLSRLRAELFDRIREEVSNWDVEPVHAGIFGSFARGTATSDSDIDVLLVRPTRMGPATEGTWLAQMDRLDRKIHSWTGNDAQIIDIAPATLSRLAREDDPLVDSWMTDQVHLFGERIMDLLRSAR